ncbi:FAD-dependent oxidoreductase [Variovorax sp. LjRoot290]|uniref:NAD(P)/FAD-dependent oxidoreductase n=1 Tax=unclassified Variovorax TaxID=663243 RepID=UPI003ECD1078
MERDIVVIGGGHAAAQFCAGMAEAGQGARVHLVCEEPDLPYQRPPLSKSFLKRPDEAAQSIRGEAWYPEAGIELHLGTAAEAIDREARVVRLAGGRSLPYGVVVLATGTRARVLPGLPSGLSNVVLLRTAADARALRTHLGEARQVVVLGGGFIGLEIAATAQALGRQVTVLEAAPRLLSRSLSPEMAEHVLLSHRAAGVDIRLGEKVSDFEVAQARLRAIHLGAQRVPLDLLIIGIGARPETTLAQAAGLDCRDGVVVDAFMRSSDARILAIGDCARFPLSGQGSDRRLESVQNAHDQARTAVATVLDRPAPYAALPWFWSEQGSMRLQMAGCMPAQSVRHLRPGARGDAFSILHYTPQGRLACVESVNAPQDHMAARKLLEAGHSPAPAAACNPATALKTFT